MTPGVSARPEPGTDLHGPTDGVRGSVTSEQRLCSALQGSRLGLPFRRQLVISRYIADFVCIKARLVVEVDGGVHEGREHLDAHRDKLLERAGYRVLRIPVALVISNLEAAVALIREALAT